MSYRKEKKKLSILLKRALREVDIHPLSNSTNYLVKLLISEMAELKRNKK